MKRIPRKIVIATLCLAFFAGVPRLWAQGNQNQPQSSRDVELEKLRIQLEREAEQKEWQTRIFDIKYANLMELQQILGLFRADIRSPQVGPNGTLRALSVRAPKEIMPAIEETIRRFDVPPPPKKSVELTMFVVSATQQPSAATMPPALQPVITELRKVLSYTGFQLLDTMIIRGVDGETPNYNGLLPPFASGISNPIPYSFRAILRLHINEQKEPILRLDDMRFNARTNFGEVGLSTDVEVPRGQQVVVGKVTVGDSALILVISSRMLD